ncbi:unnamed protein product, partial [Rotaria magnacalcarata]
SCFTKNAEDISGRLARWTMKLSAFQIESIQYRPGTENTNADSLLRNPITNYTTEAAGQSETEDNEYIEKNVFTKCHANNSLTTYELSTIHTIINLWENTNILEDIKKEQQIDSNLHPIIQNLKTITSPAINDKRQPFVLVNDILYKIKNSNRHYNQRILGNKHLLVFPKAMQYKLLQWAHDHPTAGHAGQQKTLFRLSTRVYWASMRKDIYYYVAACQECQRFKYNNRPMATPMQLHEVLEPWHTIGIDIMGQFPTTSRQKKSLIVIVDYFTRWVEVFPMRTTTSTNIAQILINEVFSRYGLPKYILSDNGPQFMSNIFEDFCNSFGIEQKFTDNYHPQSNMTERVNRTLKPIIAIFAQRSPRSWDKEIQKLAYAIRTSANETTGDTPAFLIFARNPRTPLDLIVGDPIEGLPTTTFEQTQVQNYKTSLINNLRTAFNMVHEHSEIEKWNQKEKYDRHTSHRKFEVGDLVWVATTIAKLGDNTIRGKLQPRYQGPCRITKELTPSTFIVQRLGDNVNLGATNVERLKIYFKPFSNENLDNTSNSDLQSESENIADVQSDNQDDTES